VPTVLTIHDIRQLEPQDPVSFTARRARDIRRAAWWLGPAARRAARIVTVSEFSKGRIVELLQVDPAKVIVVGNGVTPEFYRIAAADPCAMRRPCADPYLLSIGGLHPEKGVDDLLALAAALHARRAGLKIVIAGQRHLESYARARELENVLFLGKVSDADLVQYTRAAVAVLVLSRYEGFGIPAVEAMAAGTPAVVANRTALPEVVSDSGLVVDPADTGQLADLVERLARDAVFRNRYAELGRARAKSMTWAACTERLIAAFGSA
jgi:glycosyltransferase involved in cell wall biosynthesis